MPSLSQTYRPRRFADVTGQQHVTETLRAEVATGSLGHAFLFSGPRGVGKTTCARILAKALGCDQPQNGEPCGVCPSCTMFQEGRSIDVIEIDAATHTGVDMIREAIVEHVRFTPAGKRKVYILDEAHMLSTASWNALLKTLEEPPAYAFFVFATTEWHKVPATIVSRCQRFEFRRIKETDMVARLQDICRAEKWDAEEAVLKLIASRAEGCQRDAETLLGQIGSLADAGKISLATAGLVMPFSAYEHALSWLEFCRDGATASAVEAMRAWYDAGISFPTLMDDLLQLIKRLMLAQANEEEAQALAKGTNEERRLAALIPTWSGRALHDLAVILIDRRRDMKLGMDPVFVMLLAFTKTTTQPSIPALRGPGVCRSDKGEEGDEIGGDTSATVPAAPIAPVVRAASVPVSRTPSPAPAPSAIIPPPSVIPAQAGIHTAAESTPPVPPSVPPSMPDVSQRHNDSLDLSGIRRLWNAFIRTVEEQNHSLPVILKISKPERIEGDTLVIRFPYPFHRDKIIGDNKNLRIVQACAQKAFNMPNLRLDGVVMPAEEEAAAATSQEDVVGNLLKTFGGSVVENP